MPVDLYKVQKDRLKYNKKIGIKALRTDVTIKSVRAMKIDGKLLTVEYRVLYRSYFVNCQNGKIVNAVGRRPIRLSRMPSKKRFKESWVIDVSNPNKYMVHSINRKILQFSQYGSSYVDYDPYPYE